MPALSLPPSIVQPFDLRYLSDDLHVIAYFSGHPEYEAVEAMISIRQDGTFAIRAILTAHDQKQVDHLNDAGLFALATRSGRTTVQRAITADIDLRSKLPSAEVRFMSHKDEPILLRLECASPPDPARGGVTDPGAHSISTTLPVMVRGASAMAGSSSRVSVAGIDYPIPVKVRAGPYFTGHDGYFTRSYHMAVLRLGKRQLRVLRRPRALDAGEQWRYETPEGLQTYEIMTKDAEGNLTVAAAGFQREVIRGRATSDGFALSEVAVPSNRSPDEGTSLLFSSAGGFSIRVDAHANAVTGSVFRTASNELEVRPGQPDWATQRTLRVRWHEAGDALTLETFR